MKSLRAALGRADWHLVLLAASGLLLLVALARPAALLPRSLFRYAFIFDVTQSMNVQDAAGQDSLQSRLEFAKAAARSSLEQLPCGSEAGLGVFTEHRAFMLIAPVEVCEHFGVLTTLIEAMDWRIAWAARSEVAKGLHSSLLAVAQLQQETRLVFITDGHEAPPVNPTFAPRYTGTPGEIFGAIVGVGGSVPVPIPRLAADGELTGYWRAEEVLQVDRYRLGRGSTVNRETMVGVEAADVDKLIAQGREHLSSLRAAYLKKLAAGVQLDYLQPSIPAELGTLLRTEKYAHRTVALTDLRWLAGLLTLACMLLTLVPARPAQT